MDPVVVLTFVILSLLTAVVFLFIFRKKPAASESDASSDYADGLNLLLLGKREQALSKLKEAVKKDSRNIDAYIKIGDIMREIGQVEKAINVHKYLTVRSGLSRKQRQDIIRSLAEDYLAMKEFDKALDVLNKVLESDRNVVWAHEMRLKLLEEKEDWPRAFQVYKDFRKFDHDFSAARLAHYKVQEGVSLRDDNKNKDAQIRFREAMKIAPDTPPAYMNLADLYISENRKEEALKVLKEFVERVPSQSFLAFERIEELLYEGGVYGEIENLYLEIIAKQPDNLMAKLALIENLEKKGEFKKAIDLCHEVLEKDSANKTAKQYLVQLYHRLGQNENALNMALEVINENKDNPSM
jgi:lipopolysaccharide biosynthesis regulator YciM